MLYAIWERVIQENQQEISLDSQVEISFLKESQFYMACKLVAIYQKHVEDGAVGELTAEMVNGNISTPLKYLAKFDFTKFSSE